MTEKKHLTKLGTNTKKTEKWVQDNMMQYDWWGKKRYLSLESAISSLNLKKNNLCFWSISPNISYDFLWYKNRSTKIVNQNISNSIPSDWIRMKSIELTNVTSNPRIRNL